MIEHDTEDTGTEEEPEEEHGGSLTVWIRGAVDTVAERSKSLPEAFANPEPTLASYRYAKTAPWTTKVTGGARVIVTGWAYFHVAVAGTCDGIKWATKTPGRAGIAAVSLLSFGTVFGQIPIINILIPWWINITTW